jgi:hypothetical protein
MRVGYVRMYNDAAGESHFEDLTVGLEERDFAPPAAPAYVAPFLETSGTLFFGVQGPGDLILVDDAEGKGHSTHVVGRDELVIFGAVLADQRTHSGPS